MMPILFFEAWPYVLHLLIIIAIYVILSMSLNLITGFTGLLNLGHVGFYAIGAYTATLFVMNGVPFWLALIIAAIVAGIFGLLIGIPSLGLRGDYLAIATLGFAEIIRALLINETWLTRGPLGIPGIPRPEIFGFVFEENEMFLLLSLLLVVITYVVIKRLTTSSFGMVLTAIREDEIAALAIGKDVNKYKLIVIGIGAAFAGIAGVLFAFYITFIDPTSFIFAETVLMVSMVVLGGLGSLGGSIIGTIILVLLPEPLRIIGAASDIEIFKTGFANIRMIIYSLILIALMIKKPEGIMGRIEYLQKSKKESESE